MGLSPINGAPVASAAPAKLGDRVRQAPFGVRVAVLAALALGYFLAARLGLKLAFVHPSASAVWPPTGITLVAFLALGYRVWPGIFAGAFLANLFTAGTAATSLAIAAGNTFEGLLGAYLVNRFAGGLRAAEHARDLFKLAALAALGSTAVSATVGVTSLALAGVASWNDFGSIWLTWWLGDAAGDLVLAPALLAWIASPHVGWKPGEAVEAALILVSLLLIGMFVFGGFSPSPITDYPLEYLCVPLLIWTAFRFGPRETATAIVGLSAIAISGTLNGVGPFVRDSPNVSLLLLQSFMGVSAVTSLALAAVVAERKQVESELRELAVTDPLTGLANYRHLMSALEGEIERSRRSDRPFSILFLDVDHLKSINDVHGHLVGSEALCRVAAALHAVCRAIDTPARLGGDEFAVVLPEAAEMTARGVAQRVTARLAREGHALPVTVSVGVAEYPRDGQTAEALLGRADALLYAAKVRQRG